MFAIFLFSKFQQKIKNNFIFHKIQKETNVNYCFSFNSGAQHSSNIVDLKNVGHHYEVHTLDNYY